MQAGIVVGAIVFLIIHCITASEMSNIAKQKGHDKSRYFHYCFWMGILGYLLVIALPDLSLREALKQAQPQAPKAPKNERGAHDTPATQNTQKQYEQHHELPPL